jgi:hypothetical protein
MTSRSDPWDDDEEPEETPEEMAQVAEAALVLAEMMRERGVTTAGQLGNLPPLDPETKAKYLARARARADLYGDDDDVPA